MAENAEVNVNAAQGDAGGEEPDYKALYEQLKADSRKWEQRAKDNKEKADKWDATTKGNESVEDRIAALEAENEAMKAAEARRTLIARIANEVGLEEGLIAPMASSDKDEETLLAEAQYLAEKFESVKPKGAPNVPEAGKFPRGKADTDEKRFVRQLFGEE